MGYYLKPEYLNRLTRSNRAISIDGQKRKSEKGFLSKLIIIGYIEAKEGIKRLLTILGSSGLSVKKHALLYVFSSAFYLMSLIELVGRAILHYHNGCNDFPTSSSVYLTLTIVLILGSM